MGKEVINYIDPAMYEATPVQKDERGQVVPQVTLLWATPDPLGAIAAAYKMYEGIPIYSLSEITNDDRKKYWDEIHKTHLKAPLEYVQFHFFIEGVTRSFTHQMVRQRTAVYSQESMRFAVKHDLAAEAAMPPSIAALPENDDRRELWLASLKQTQDAYNELVSNGIPAEDARGLMPHAATTRLHYGTDLRALAEHAGNRLCTQAQFEWRMVFFGIMRALRGQGQMISTGEGEMEGTANGWQWDLITSPAYPTFAPICYKLGKCAFTSVADRACSIRDRVQEGKFNEIDPLEWAADPMAARRGTN